jgi:hypothetical protein
MRFQNPNNGYVETVSAPGLWCLLFGPFYFASKGAWSHALISAVIAVFTCGLSWLIYPFFAGKAIERQYLRSGWTKLDGPLTTGAPSTHPPTLSNPTPKGRSQGTSPVRVLLGLLGVAALVLSVMVSNKSTNTPASSNNPATQSSKTNDDVDSWRYSNIEWAKQILLKILRDPDSAQFRDVSVVAPKQFDAKKPGMVCGYVNSKNGFGGFTGFEPFMVMAGAIPIFDDHTSAFDKLWNQNCANKRML